MIRVGVVGYGYWGPNLVRNFSELDEAEMVAVCDLSDALLAKVRARYPSIRTTSDIDELLNDPNLDALAVATPVSTHFDLAMKALKAGKHVLVEKPLSARSDECRSLIDEAEKRRLTLMVDHTFPYNGAVRKIRELVAGGGIGEVYYFDSVRVNLGLFQHDVSVIWDLAVHDLSIIDYLLPARPIAVSCTGMAHVEGQPANTAYITLIFPTNLIAHIHVNWLAPVKIRRTLIGGSEKMIVYDDMEPTEKIKVYDKGITVSSDPDSVYKMRVGYRGGDVWSPQFDGTEALHGLTSHFVSCIERGEQPLTGGESGLRVVSIMEAATESMNSRGRAVELSP